MDLTNISDFCFRFTDRGRLFAKQEIQTLQIGPGASFLLGIGLVADSVYMASRLMAETCPRLVKAWFLLVIANNVQYFKYIFQCTIFSTFSNVQYFGFRNSCYYEHWGLNNVVFFFFFFGKNVVLIIT